MGDLAAFILARIAEDEAAARDAGGEWWVPAKVPGPTMRKTPDQPTETIIDSPSSLITYEVARDEFAAHIARHDPARVLAESTALRAVVGLHAPDHECTDGSGNYPGVFAGDPALGMAPCPTLRALASIWADHPDYDPAWRLR